MIAKNLTFAFLGTWNTIKCCFASEILQVSDEIASCKPLAGMEPHLEKFSSVDIYHRKKNVADLERNTERLWSCIWMPQRQFFHPLYIHSVGGSSLGIGCGSRDSINQTRSALLMIARFRLGRGTNVSETDRVMSNRHMADAIQLSSYGFHHIVLQNAALATVYSEDTCFFWVILCSLAFLIDSCIEFPEKLPLWKTG